MEFAISFITGWAVLIAALVLLTIGFAVYRKIYCKAMMATASKKQWSEDGEDDDEIKETTTKSSITNRTVCARRRTFHSTQDDGRLFIQIGYAVSNFGACLLYSWIGLMIPAYGCMVFLAVISYMPQIYVDSWGTDWNGVTGPYLFVFAIFHIIAAFMILYYEAIRTKFMLPQSSLATATHVLIEEEVPAVDDSEMVGIGMAEDERKTIPRVLKKMLKKCHKITQSWSSSRCKTLVRINDELDASGEVDRTIEYTCVRYHYDVELDRFRPVGCDEDTTAFEAHQLLKNGGLSNEEASATQRVVGPNQIGVKVPTILESLVIEFSSIFYVIQNMGSWTYLGYSGWNIGSVWFAMMIVTGVAKAIFIVRRGQKKISDLARHSEAVRVLRDSEWIDVESSEVVLGDILIIEEGQQFVCDGYIVNGTAVANESMLTGEPLPVQKVEAPNYEGAKFGSKNKVYAGTLCMQSNGDYHNRAVMLVTAVGGLTTKGQLVRMVMFPQSVKFKYLDQLPLVYGMLFTYSIMLSIVYIAATDMGDWIVTILQVLISMLQSINPMLPVAMVMGQTVAAKRLRNHHKIFCLQPERIPVAGKISVMVFDKTGTITKDGMELVGALPVTNGQFADRLNLSDTSAIGPTTSTNVLKMPELMQFGLAACHTVTKMRSGQLVGNNVEVAMVEASGWSLPEMDDSDQVLKSSDGSKALEMVRPLHFDHTRMTSGCIVREHSTDRVLVIIKGSYEKVGAGCKAGASPRDYETVSEALAADSYYVLGMGYKELPGETTDEELQRISRSDLETGLSLVGLLLFKNEVKSDSALAIKMLKDGDIRSVVCTGDNALTAIGISKEVGIIDYNKPILLANINNNQLTWIDPDSGDKDQVPVHGVHQLAATRPAWKYLCENPQKLDQYWQDICVFARMKPDDKVSVIKSLQSRKLVVGMCGDGGNDCGALRAAHAAMALSEAEASMVSPFSSSRDSSSLITVVDLIREGRACLTTNIATYSFYIVYAFVLTGGRLAVTIMGNYNMGEWVYLMTDIALGVGMVWTMTLSGPTKHLAPYRPTASLLGWRTILACAVPIVLSYIMQIIAYAMLWSSKNSDWYYQVNTLDLKVPAKDWTKKGDNYDTAVQVFILLVTVSTHAFVATYGGAFRCNILRNWSVTIFYCIFIGLSFALLWVNPCDLSCVYRVSCDSGASLSTGSIPFVSEFSVGNIGGCFMGPQVHHYQQLGYPDWTPSPEYNCLPPQESLQLLPYDSPQISALGYDGPNNVFSFGYRIFMTVLLAVVTFVMYAFVNFGLLGCGAAFFRSRVRGGDHWFASRGTH